MACLGGRFQLPILVAISLLGGILTFTAVMYANFNHNIRYSTSTANSPVYKIHAVVEEIGDNSFASN